MAGRAVHHQLDIGNLHGVVDGNVGADTQDVEIVLVAGLEVVGEDGAEVGDGDGVGAVALDFRIGDQAVLLVGFVAVDEVAELVGVNAVGGVPGIPEGPVGGLEQQVGMVGALGVKLDGGLGGLLGLGSLCVHAGDAVQGDGILNGGEGFGLGNVLGGPLVEAAGQADAGGSLEVAGVLGPPGLAVGIGVHVHRDILAVNFAGNGEVQGANAGDILCHQAGGKVPGVYGGGIEGQGDGLGLAHLDFFLHSGDALYVGAGVAPAPVVLGFLIAAVGDEELEFLGHGNRLGRSLGGGNGVQGDGILNGGEGFGLGNVLGGPLVEAAGQADAGGSLEVAGVLGPPGLAVGIGVHVHRDILAVNFAGNGEVQGANAGDILCHQAGGKVPGVYGGGIEGQGDGLGLAHLDFFLHSGDALYVGAGVAPAPVVLGFLIAAVGNEQIELFGNCRCLSRCGSDCRTGGKERQHQHNGQESCKCLLHVFYLPNDCAAPADFPKVSDTPAGYGWPQYYFTKKIIC